MFTDTNPSEDGVVGQVSRLATYKNLQLRGLLTDDPKLRMLGELALVTDITKKLFAAGGARPPLGLLYSLQSFTSEMCEEYEDYELPWKNWDELREEERLAREIRWDLEALEPNSCECARCCGVDEEATPPLKVFAPSQEMRATAKREATLREEGRRVRRRASEDEAEEPTPKRSLRNHRRANAELEALI